MPHATIDPVMMAARFVVDVQSVVSREKDPTEFGVVSFGTIQGGSAANVIPDDVLLTGTIRTYKPEVRVKLIQVSSGQRRRLLRCRMRRSRRSRLPGALRP